MDGNEYFRNGDALYDAGQLEEALSVFLEGARIGDTSCMTRAANMYTSGEGVACCDYDKAAYLEKQAVEAGDVTAIVNLAITCRLKGDLQAFRIWCERALDAGDGSAGIELAKLYLVANQSMIAKRYLEIARSTRWMSEDDLEEVSRLLSEID